MLNLHDALDDLVPRLAVPDAAWWRVFDHAATNAGAARCVSALAKLQFETETMGTPTKRRSQ